MVRNALQNAWKTFRRHPFALIVLIILVQLILGAGFLFWVSLMGRGTSTWLLGGPAAWGKYPQFTEKAALLALLVAALVGPFALGGAAGVIGELVRSGNLSLGRFAAHGLRFYGRTLAALVLALGVLMLASAVLLSFLSPVVALLSLQVLLVGLMPLFFYLLASLALENQGGVAAIRSSLARYRATPGASLLLALALAGVLLLTSFLQQVLTPQGLLGLLPPALTVPASLIAIPLLIALEGFAQSFVFLAWFFAYAEGVRLPFGGGSG